MKRITTVVLMAVLFALAPALLTHAGPANPGQSDAHGNSLGEWMKLYFTWSLGGPQDGAVKHTIFLPIPVGAPSPKDETIYVGKQNFTLGPGDSFVLPMFTFYGESYLPSTGLADDDPSFPPKSVFVNAEVQIKLDGKVIIDSRNDDLRDFYFTPQFFDEPVTYDEPSSYGSIAAIWVKGIGFVHPPLSPGKHRLQLFVYNHIDFGFGLFGYDNTWDITVSKK